MKAQKYTDQPAKQDSQVDRKPPIWRLHIMRGLFFLNFIGLAFDTWPIIFSPQEQMDTLTGVAYSFWASFSLLNFFGIRFPLKFLPILLLQLLYKTAWIISTYLPAKNSGLLNEDLDSFLWICVAGIVLDVLIIPWGYVYRSYLKNLFKLK